MKGEINRIKVIQEILMEMASGNFFYRLELDGSDDYLAGLVMAVNMLSEEIQDRFPSEMLESDNVHLVQMSMLIDIEGKIEMVCSQGCRVMGLVSSNLLGKPVTIVLKQASKEVWKRTLLILQKKEFTDTTVDLEFITKKGLLISKRCHIGLLKGVNAIDDKILITSILQSTHREELEKRLKIDVMRFSSDKTQKLFKPVRRKTIPLSSDDIKMLSTARSIISTNPENKLGTLKTFALRLGTNEYKLKNGFKQLYGVSVYRYQIRERLKKSATLVQYSDIPLKDIAQLTGFKTYPHFSKAFKKRYGYTPRQLRNYGKNHKGKDITEYMPKESENSKLI